MDTILPIEKVKDLLPQKDPFVMLSHLISFDEEQVTTGLLIKADNIFVEDGFFNASGMIENMAQSIALQINYGAFLKNLSVPAGYIGNIKNINLISRPQIGDKIVTDAKIITEFMGVTLVEAEIKLGNKTLFTAQLKTVIAQ